MEKLYNAACILHCTFDRGIKVGWMGWGWYACMHVRCMQYKNIIQTLPEGESGVSARDGKYGWMNACMHVGYS